MFEPGGAFALVVQFRHREMRKQLVRRGAMPVAHIRRNDDRIAGADLLHLFALSLHAAGAG